jgi:hypothetical protein
VRKSAYKSGARVKGEVGGKRAAGSDLPKLGRPPKSCSDLSNSSANTSKESSADSKDTSILYPDFEDAVDEPIVSNMCLFSPDHAATSTTLQAVPKDKIAVPGEGTMARLIRERREMVVDRN